MTKISFLKLKSAQAACIAAGCWLADENMVSSQSLRSLFQDYVVVFKSGDKYIDTSVEFAKAAVSEFLLFVMWLEGALTSTPLSGPGKEVKLKVETLFLLFT